jgi:hypothetical protein
MTTSGRSERLRERFLSLSPPQQRIVHDLLVEQALARWQAHAEEKGEIRYRETVTGTEQIVDASLPEDAVRAVRTGEAVDTVNRRYGEPSTALQDNDLSFPDAVEFAYYAVLNYFRKYALQRDVDNWLIVNQAVSSVDERKWEDTLRSAIEKAIALQ